MNKLIVFVKAPVPGRVKTRLCPPLSFLQAARLYQAFAKDTLESARKFDGWDSLEIAYAPEKPFENADWLTPPSLVSIQQGRDMGERLTRAFNHGFLSGAKKVVIIGSDTPHLKLELIDQAFNVLKRSDAVIGPAEDGGYYLIGLSRPNAELFIDIPWSTNRVLETTLRRVATCGVAVELLAPFYDVDTPENLRLLLSYISRMPRNVLAHTRAALKDRSDGICNIYSLKLTDK